MLVVNREFVLTWFLLTLLQTIASSNKHQYRHWPKRKCFHKKTLFTNIGSWGSHHGVEANLLDCDIIVNEFELHSLYYAHFRINNLGKSMNPLIHSSYGLNSTPSILLQGTKVGMTLKKEIKPKQTKLNLRRRLKEIIHQVYGEKRDVIGVSLAQNHLYSHRNNQ